MLKIIEKKKIWFLISSVLIIIGLLFGIFRGLNFGIDFLGGTELVLQMNDSFNKQEADGIVKNYASDAVTNTSDNNQYEIKSSDLTSDSLGKLVSELKTKYSLEDNPIVSQDEIGASIGSDLKKNAIIALLIAFVAMTIYIAIRFKIDYGIAALAALFHDIAITMSVYAIFHIPINTPFIAAVLTIICYSMNDTIVIFDRIRENKRKIRSKSNTEVADISLTETMSRSINTSLVTLFSIIAVYAFVPSVRDFTFPIIIGVISGAYSSIFIAAPVWVLIRDRKNKNGIKEVKKAEKVLV